MLSIVLWVLGVSVLVFYGSRRIHRLYVDESKLKEKFYKQGFILIFYSTLIVGATGILSASVQDYMISNAKVSVFWVSIQSIAELLRYLAPFIFAAIGVNMISHAVTSKNA